VLAAASGYATSNYFFIEPRGELTINGLPHVIGLAAYAFTCSLILWFGQAARRAHSRAIQDVSEQRRREQEKTQQLLTARLLSSIIESTDDAIVSKSLDGIIQSWNVGAERLFGYSAEQAIGRHISLIIPPERLKEEDDIIVKLKAGQRIDHFETERQRADGRRLVVSLTISPLKDATGTIIGASKTICGSWRRTWRRQTAGRTSSSPCSRTSFVTRWHRSAMPRASCVTATRIRTRCGWRQRCWNARSAR
jgi:PAS domain S-box-containing protein